MEGPSVEKIDGIVKDSTGRPMPGVKVELYDHPEVWFDAKLANSVNRRKGQKKLGETVTDDKGHFAFGPQRKGKYELYCTVSEFNPLSYLVKVVSKKKAEAQQLRIVMELAG